MALLIIYSLVSCYSFSLLVEIEMSSFLGVPLIFPLLIDSTSLLFLFTVFLITGCVITFSSSYIQTEKFNARFHWLVLSFVISIVLLIVSPNLLSLLLGWDGLGLTSYLLVVYFQSAKSFNAGLLTALRNRVGDVLLLLAIACLISYGSINFTLEALSGQLSPISLRLVGLAACTKRAQIPFSAWLPAAIAAPTPVSALVHSSTLVTAGIYLLIRFSPALPKFALLSLLCVGSLTIFIAGLAALRETDIKKVVALSTLRQLGVIIATLGAGLNFLAFFHLISHAFFKALLFISVGRMIHLASSYQDLRKASLLRRVQPSSVRLSLLASISLCGIPFTRGFYSKDLCIEINLILSGSFPLLVLFFLATVLTCAYSVRFLAITSIKLSRTCPLIWRNDQDTAIWRGILGLVPCAVMRGSLWRWRLLSCPSRLRLSRQEKLFAFIAVTAGIALGWSLIIKRRTLSKFSASDLRIIIWALPIISAFFWTFPINPWAASIRHTLDLNWNRAPGLPFILGVTPKHDSFLGATYFDAFAGACGLILVLLVFLYTRTLFSKLYWSQIPKPIRIKEKYY